MNNREIKFRAWNNEYDVMWDGENSSIFQWVESGQDIEVIEFTGLTDKNGVEIYYNSDIFKFKFMTSVDEYCEMVGVMDFNDEELRAEIDVYGDKDYVCLYYKGNGEMFDFEVIGNIHENPELLEVGK